MKFWMLFKNYSQETAEYNKILSKIERLDRIKANLEVKLMIIDNQVQIKRSHNNINFSMLPEVVR